MQYGTFIRQMGQPEATEYIARKKWVGKPHYKFTIESKNWPGVHYYSFNLIIDRGVISPPMEEEK